ncbi:MAG: hypothetical protein AABW67_03310 [Nanoarchaeota archaeon]
MPEPPKDVTIQLAEHIKNNLLKGYTVDALRFSLITQGYSRITIEKAIQRANQELARKAPVMVEKPQIAYKIEPEPENTSFWQTIKGWFR